MNDDELIRQLFQDSDGAAQQRALWDDFQLFMTLIFFKTYCEGQDDPKEMGETLISQWRKRVLTQMEGEMKKEEAFRESPMGKLFGELLPAPESIPASLQDNLNDVEQILRRILNIKA
jgi:hypothetical protein